MTYRRPEESGALPKPADPLPAGEAPPPESRAETIAPLRSLESTWSLTLFGLCVYTVSVVTSRFPLADVGAGIAVVGLLLQLGKLRMPRPVWLYSAFVLWAFLASVESRYPDVAKLQVVEQLKLFVVILIIINALRTEKQLRFYLLFFLACFMIYPARGALQAYAGGYTTFGRAIWNYIYANPNDLATLSLLAMGVALALAFSSPSRPLVRFGAIASAILLVTVILLTQSRGAFIGLVAGMGLPLLRSGMRRPFILIVTAAIIGTAVAMALPDSVWERLSGMKNLMSSSTIADADPEGSAAQRFEVQKVALQIIRDHTLFGVGLGVYSLENANYAPQIGKLDTHNTYLNLAAEVGLPGLLLWCGLVWSVLRYAYRRRKLAAPGPLVTQQAWLERALWAYLVAGMFGSYAKLTFPYLMLAVVWSSATLLVPAPAQSGGSTSKSKA